MPAKTQIGFRRGSVAQWVSVQAGLDSFSAGLDGGVQRGIWGSTEWTVVYYLQRVPGTHIILCKNATTQQARSRSNQSLHGSFFASRQIQLLHVVNVENKK